jgi:hypothetical protein
VKREELQRRQNALRSKLADDKPAPDATLPFRIKERHYTIKEIVGLWNGVISHDTVRRLFINEPGVFDASPGAASASKYKRHHRLLLIPESVLIRVYRKRSNPEIFH